MNDFLTNQQYLFVCMDLSPADKKQTVIYCSNTRYAAQAQEAIDFNQKQIIFKGQRPVTRCDRRQSNGLRQDLIERCPFWSKNKSTPPRDGRTDSLYLNYTR